MATVIAAFLLLAACGSNGGESLSATELTLRVMTFNTGIPRCEDSADAQYTCDPAAIADDWYGNGLSFVAVMDDTRAFFDAIRPDIVGFQEIFHPGGQLTVVNGDRNSFDHMPIICDLKAAGDVQPDN